MVETIPDQATRKVVSATTNNAKEFKKVKNLRGLCNDVDARLSEQKRYTSKCYLVDNTTFDT